MRRAGLLIITFLFGLVISLAVPAGASSFSATAGSSADPLVTASYVENYVAQKFAPVEARLAALKDAVYDFYGLESKEIVLYIGSAFAQVDNKKMAIDSQNDKVVPYINSDSRTMVPVRFVAEALGAKVDWNSDTRTVHISYNGTQIDMIVDNNTYLVNGEAKTMDTPPVINSGWNRTMVPVRFVAEALGCTLDWEPKSGGATTTVYISR